MRFTPEDGLADTREWLEADGLGGFAMGTATGVRTRRYHAVLLAAATPPTGRMALVQGVEACCRHAEAAQRDERVAPPVREPGIAGDDRAAASAAHHVVRSRTLERRERRPSLTFERPEHGHGLGGGGSRQRRPHVRRILREHAHGILASKVPLEQAR